MDLQRAYALFEIKTVDDEQRVIEGMATTPTPDRMDDIVEPAGATFSLPIPLLWQHESRDAAIGEVFAAKATKDGIQFKARIASDDEPGPLKDRLDYAWRAIKKKLVRGVSIGFNAMESADIAGSFGRRFTKWDWLELSAVTIPANAEATILTVKQHASPPADSRVGRPAVAGHSVKMLTTTTGRPMLNIQEQIKGFEATRQAKAARQLEIQEEAAKAGRTKDEAEQEEFDTISGEVKALDRELKDLRELEKSNIEAAKPVTSTAPAGGTTLVSGNTQTAGHTVVRGGHQALPPGIRFARMVKAVGWAHRKHRDVEVVAREMYPDDALVQKAAVAAGTTTGTGWADGLVGDETSVFADFVEFLRPQTILGKFGNGGIPSLRRVPFRTPLITQTTGGAGYWVGEGKAKGLTKFDFTRRTLDPLKVANIAVLTEELLKASSPSAETVVRDQLAAALRERLDTDFIDPASAASAGLRPASITNAVAAITSSGIDADAVRADIAALMGTFIAANNAPTTGVWIMSANSALSLGLMTNPLGQPEFPGISMNGGSFAGLPVIVSEYVPTDSGGSIVVLANASDIYLADEGEITVDVSREASLQMDSAPTGTSHGGEGHPVHADMVSLWQTNSVGFRAERTINWLTRRDSAVAVLDAVNWGAAE